MKIRLPHSRWTGAASWRFRCCVIIQVPDSSTSAGTCGRLSEDHWRPHRCFEQMLASEKEARAAALNKEEQRKKELHLLQVELRVCASQSSMDLHRLPE
ncbi:hypothetical protein HPB47_013879 [Ixodes persulcatus]|uniref:Uncharacterized protein n=1 Tax=Ixodes persulcatus TaxID=34615 RepID=A0AC60R284_IXOPE|nr:hypothetical protein HPB47_013879 [Ixodes persulcatus]